MQWIVDNLALIGQIAAAVLALASVITALTPTPKDDSVVAWIQALLGRLGVLTHRDAPGTLKAPLRSAAAPILHERLDVVEEAEVVHLPLDDR